MHPTSAIRGMLLPLPTVFDAEAELDESVQRDLVQHYVAKGVHALFILGSYGQGPAMRLDQRKRAAEVVVEEVHGRIPVVVHIGAVDPYSSIELGLHARSIGADAVGMVGPYYYNDRTPTELLMHFQMVDQAVQLPLFIYNNPGYQGYPIDPPFMQQLVAAVPRIFGAKLAMGTIESALKYLAVLPDFALFALASGIYPGLKQGLRGTVSPPLTLAPELGVDLVRAIDEGRDADAERLQGLVSEVNALLLRLWKQYGRTPYYLGLREMGFDVKKYPRWPTAPLPEEERVPLMDLLRRARGVVAV